MNPMSKYPKISSEHFHSRAVELAGGHLLFVFGIMKGISIAAAAVVIADIILNAWGTIYNSIAIIDGILEVAVKIALFCTSFQVMLVTYDGAFFGTLFISKIPGRKETTYNFIQAGLEFLLFAILAPQIFNIPDSKSTINLDNLVIWFCVFSLYGLYAYRIIKTAINSIDIDNHDARIKYVVKNYLNDLKAPNTSSPLNGSKMSALISLIMFVILVWVAFFQYLCNAEESAIWCTIRNGIMFLMGILLFVNVRKAYIAQHKKRIKVAAYISGEGK